MRYLTRTGRGACGLLLARAYAFSAWCDNPEIVYPHFSNHLFETMRESQKARIQQQLIHRTLAETWQRLQYLTDQVPEGVDCEQDKQAREHVLNIWAIEEEWIIDPELRAELSMIQTDDEPD